MRPHAAGSLALVSSLAVAIAVGACGGGGGEGGQGTGAQVPPGPTGTPPSPVTSASASAAPPPSGSSTNAAGVAPTAMKPIAASNLIEDLKKIGVDPQKPQALNKLPPDVIRKLMPTFSKSLGVKCDFCHDTNNFKAWTPKKHVAEGMWQHFVIELSMDDGTPVYCDSCHGGKAGFLDRSDRKALSAWMDANYVKHLKPVAASAPPEACATCHGEPFVPKFLAQWAAR